MWSKMQLFNSAHSPWPVPASTARAWAPFGRVEGFGDGSPLGCIPNSARRVYRCMDFRHPVPHIHDQGTGPQKGPQPEMTQRYLDHPHFVRWPECSAPPPQHASLAEGFLHTTFPPRAALALRLPCKRRGSKVLGEWPPGCKAGMEPVERPHAGNHPWYCLSPVPALHQVGQDLSQCWPTPAGGIPASSGPADGWGRPTSLKPVEIPFHIPGCGVSSLARACSSGRRGEAVWGTCLQSSCQTTGSPSSWGWRTGGGGDRWGQGSVNSSPPPPANKSQSTAPLFCRGIGDAGGSAAISPCCLISE